MAFSLSSLPVQVPKLSNTIARALPPMPKFMSAQTFGISTPLPIIATPFSGSGEAINFKVRLVSVLSMAQNAPGDIKQVVFDVTPVISESRTADYSPVQPIHMPGGIQVYKTSSSRSFEVTVHLRSRNVQDALNNMKDLQILRSWLLPFFGNSSTNISSNRDIAQQTGSGSTTLSAEKQFEAKSKMIQTGADNTKGVNLLGAPPEVLYLYGYSSTQNDDRAGAPGVNINRIPTVMTSLSFSYPEDVDYIPVKITPTSTTEPFPIKMDVNMTLVETHSPVEYEQFSLAAFKSGTLKNF